MTPPPADRRPSGRQAGPAGPEAEPAQIRRYEAVRVRTEALAAPLSEADCQAQAMTDASPVKWHLAHVTWFFETFVLERFEPRFQPHHPSYRVLFNSYYNGVGAQHPRAERGLVTRPSLAEVMAWRAAVDGRVRHVLSDSPSPQALALVELGLQHEQQHQELILTDLKFLLSRNPLDPVYRPRWPLAPVAPMPQGWVEHPGGLVEIGHAGAGFAFDNEGPRHRVWLEPYALSQRLVTHGDWLAFVADGGYRTPRWWLAAGWDWVERERIQAPLYWRREAEGAGAQAWSAFTLHGRVAIDPHTPVVHVSLYEADAFARWWSAQHPDQPTARLPTEFEWEHAAERAGPSALAAGQFADGAAAHPWPVQQAPAENALVQMVGDVWQWTASAYQPYPGFQPWDGAVGEYNGKFMVDQHVLRGGSFATPRSHIRTSYRNFFPAAARWQFTGLRLARAAGSGTA